MQMPQMPQDPYAMQAYAMQGHGAYHGYGMAGGMPGMPGMNGMNVPPSFSGMGLNTATYGGGVDVNQLAPSCKLFIGGLPATITTADLHALFQAYGALGEI